ncbi:penicillin amidase [Pseudoduganella flava]|uniref:Penicillin acylase family protein n=1 Tax=Pseudoduganella flava TaxID=871742 RepID=A0A562PZN2_9BURK|nr:penicillin acylase family protein [Pseudoduganella flava]QGZ38540.1 penicillin acylase family protein [Pseudoduganella flava]TWI49901.1 penicillin amidase [Pseudoduganella flava]
MHAGRKGRWARRIGWGLLVLVAVVVLAIWFFLRGSLAQLDGKRTAPGLHGNVTVQRDALGIPAIAGGDRLDVAYATGFVHAQDRYFQMDLLRRVAAGELAELFGAKALPLDREHRLHRFRARAAAAYAQLPADDRALLERYAAGVNDGLNALGTRPFEYALVGAAPRSWSAHDSLLAIWAMYLDLQGNGAPRELSRGWLREHTTGEQLAFLLPPLSRWDAPLDAHDAPLEPAPLPATPPSWWGQPSPRDAALLAVTEFSSDIGSNNWAVAGGRSAGGGAIVSDDMHLGIKLPNTWYRAQLQVPDGNGSTRRIVGVTLPGTPFVIVGSNGHVAWGFTNSYGDFQDLVPVATDAGHPGQVRVFDKWETPAVHRETILVKGAPAETLTVRDTSQGPLFDVAGRTYALHWIAHEPTLINTNLRRLEGTNTVDEALAVANGAGIPAQNFVAGDAAGNIGWTIAGPLPRRAHPGAAATYPLADAAAGWQGWLQPGEYPRIVNPAAGQLLTANSRQLVGKGAELLGDGGYDLGARTRQARDALTALGPRTDEKGVYGVMLDDRALFQARWRERALAVLDGAAVQADPKRAEAARLLRTNWTGHASVDSTAYRISRGFMWALHDLLYGGANAQMKEFGGSVVLADKRWPEVVARLLDEQPAAWLPRQYASWRDLQLAALDRTLADLTLDGKPLAAATWGAFNTAAIAHPIASAVPALRKWLSVPADPLPGDSNMPRVAGKTFGQSERLTVSPGKEEQGIFNMPGGQSGHPLSPYFLAGHADWVNGRMTPLLAGPTQHTLAFAP